MANKVFDYYKELPSWAKGIVVVGGIAIVYFTSKSIISRIRESNKSKDAKKTIGEQKSEAEALIRGGMKPSFPDSQYSSWADAIEKQFEGCDFSWENYLLPSLFASWSGYKVYQICENLKNDVDFLKLSTAYGVRTYDKCGLWNGDFTGNFFGAISDELTEGEIKELNKLLAKKGITYKF